MFEIFFTLSHSFPFENWSIKRIDHRAEFQMKGFKLSFIVWIVFFSEQIRQQIILVSSPASNVKAVGEFEKL